MRNLLEQAIESNDGELAAKAIRDALGITSDEVTNYSFPKHWPDTRDQRARDRRLAHGRSPDLGAVPR